MKRKKKVGTLGGFFVGFFFKIMTLSFSGNSLTKDFL